MKALRILTAVSFVLAFALVTSLWAAGTVDLPKSGVQYIISGFG